MFIALDDTDGNDGGCTTHLMLRIISELGLDVKGYPRLVRLNPNIPFKTRGNAALCAEVGISRGRRRKIGEYMGKPVFSSSVIDDIPDYEHAAETAWRIVLQEARLNDEKTNPGLIISREKPDESFYLAALRSVLSVEDVFQRIKEMDIIYRYAKNGRGLIGAFSALSWAAEKSTYEMIMYNYPQPEETPKNVRREVAKLADKIHGTFNNYDDENRHAAIFPSPRTPVLCGVRTTDPLAILGFPDEVASNFQIGSTGYMLFQTNQATDDHYQQHFEQFEELSSYAFNAVISSHPVAIRGGHWFFNFLYKGKEYRAAIFEPSKGLRLLVKDLEIGDYVQIFGSFIDGKINIEKVRMIERSIVFVRINPTCRKCGSRMQNEGRERFRCPLCSNHSVLPEYKEIKRINRRNSYESPVAGRRHLVASIQDGATVS
ncbi:MAG: tRNA(Ile)(2)-agmatinylcytidine synthase [Candidatus Thermoplasmatota archaeon]|nr:tRNA(Ile)(2)-agmatinylcytidine synthase [Candidatus Thermoplasmatota archaeon]